MIGAEKHAYTAFKRYVPIMIRESNQIKFNKQKGATRPLTLSNNLSNVETAELHLKHLNHNYLMACSIKNTLEDVTYNRNSYLYDRDAQHDHLPAYTLRSLTNDYFQYCGCCYCTVGQSLQQVDLYCVEALLRFGTN